MPSLTVVQDEWENLQKIYTGYVYVTLTTMIIALVNAKSVGILTKLHSNSSSIVDIQTAIKSDSLTLRSPWTDHGGPCPTNQNYNAATTQRNQNFKRTNSDYVPVQQMYTFLVYLQVLIVSQGGHQIVGSRDSSEDT